MAVNHQFAATSERNAEEQLRTLYRKEPIRTGRTDKHVCWFVAGKTARMNVHASHRNGNSEPMYLVSVE